MKEIKVVSKKYDGSLRDSYNAYLVKETEDFIVLFIKPGTQTWDYRKNAFLTDVDGIIEVHFKAKWFNIFHICEQVSGVNLMYINLAMPVELTEDGLEWIDLDLDYRVHFDNSITILDEEEFAQNSVKMNYPSSLIEHVKAACQEIEEGLVSRVFPFNHEQQVERYQQVKQILIG